MTPVGDTRERIIDAAMDLFVYQGYGPTGLSEIAKKAGAQAGSLYHFFPTKEDLVAACERDPIPPASTPSAAS